MVNKENKRTRWRRSGWTWSTSLSTDTSGIHLQTQKGMQNSSWDQTGVPDQWESIYRTTQISVAWRNQGEKQECWENWTCPQQVGELKQWSDPHIRAIVWVREKHLRLRVKQLTCGLNGMRIRRSLPQPCIPQTGTRVAWKVQQPRAGVWGVWSNPRVRAAVDCGEMDWGKARGKIVRGIACGGKLGGPGSEAILLSHA